MPSRISEPGRTVRLDELIDGRPVGRFHVLVLALTGLVMFLDGLDTQAISFVAPAVAKEWSLPVAALGPIFSASMMDQQAGTAVDTTVSLMLLVNRSPLLADLDDAAVIAVREHPAVTHKTRGQSYSVHRALAELGYTGRPPQPHGVAPQRVEPAPTSVDEAPSRTRSLP